MSQQWSLETPTQPNEVPTSLMPIQMVNKLLVPLHCASAGCDARYSLNSETWSTIDLVDGDDDTCTYKEKNIVKHLQHGGKILRD